MPPLWAKALLPTNGRVLQGTWLAVSLTNRERLLSLASIFGNAGQVHLNLQNRNHGGKIGIAASFAIAVNRSVNHARRPGRRPRRWPRPAHCHYGYGCRYREAAFPGGRRRPRAAPARHGWRPPHQRAADPPLVSHSTTQSAPVSTAACRVCKA